MSRPISITSAVTFTPVSYTNGTNAFTTSEQYPISNAYADSNSTTYAYLTLPATANIVCQIYFNFDSSVLSSIPSDATITSVTGKVKYSANNTTRVAAVSVQLYSNTTAKGTAITTRTTSAAQYNLTAGTWSVSEIRNMRLLVSATRNNSTSNTARLNFYGADVTVNYTVDGTAYEITASSTYTGATVSPATQEVMGGESATIAIFPDDINSIVVEDNGTDVTDQLQYVTPTPGTHTFTGIPVSFDSANSVYNTNAASGGVYSAYTMVNGLTDHTSNTRCALYSVQGANAVSYMYWNFDCSSIPLNATITSVTCQMKGGTQGSTYYSAYIGQLCKGTTATGTSQSVTGTNTSPTTVTINGGNGWSRQDLNNIKIKFQVTRGNSNTTTDSTWSFYGATLTVQYTLPADPYYAYTLTNVSADHDILVSESVIVPPEEDPTKTYYSLTISSINSTTDPGRGTTRVESGTGQTITITPSDPQLTLALDNGVDVSNQLVPHGTLSPSSAVTNITTTYGFTYNSSTGYYVSNNNGVSDSAAVARVTLNLPVRALVTFQYINYAEATYDFGVFSKVDTALSTAAWNSSSNAGDTTTDAGLEQIRLNTSSYNTANAQTLTYEVSAGEHFIDVKYAKDQASNEYNDSLQFKITNIELLEPTVGYYTYDLSNISADHSLVFIFGNVTYYFVTSSTDSNAKLYPDGQMVQLPGDAYKLVVVPENTGDTITVRDNNVDVTSSLVKKEETIQKEGSAITVVNYIYTLLNVQTGHTITVYASTSDKVYLKSGNSWSEITKVYRKGQDGWVELSDKTGWFDDTKIYKRGN